MKRLTVAWLSAFLLSGSALTSYAQTNSPIPERDSSSVSLFEYATKIPKRNKVFNLDLEMHAGFNADFFSGKLDEAAFRFRDVKIDVTGEVNDRLFYWYRQTLNGGYEGQALENLNESIEYAYIGYKLNERFTLTAGKQDVFYGGFEYDENPLLIYEYSDMNEYSLCYLTGIGLGYQPNESQEIRLQVTNSRMGSMEDEYGRLPEGFKKPRVPLFYTLNWNGNFNNVFKTRWSASVMNEAKSHNMYYYALGNELNLGKWNAFVDFMYSKEDIDRKGIITSIVGRPGGHNAFDANYLSVVAKCNYRFLPKWNVFVKGMYETASVGKASEGIEKGNYRTSWGYLGGIEYYPMETNLHFFVTYVGRSYDFTSRAKVLGQENYSTNRISVGFIWQMPVF